MKLFDFEGAGPQIGDSLTGARPAIRWGVDSEFGRLTDVMLAAPRHLEIVPCNAVSIASQEAGLSCSPHVAEAQHAALVRTLEMEGVRCHVVAPDARLPDLAFTRDTSLMTPWGMVGLRPSAAHRCAEVDAVRAAAMSWGVPLLDTIEEGRVEGGDVCLIRPGLVAIGYSGERTDRTGAEALARIFEARGWRAILTRFDPRFLHLDTQFTMVDRSHAVACVEALEDDFLLEVQALEIDILPASYAEVQKLGSNLFSLGSGRVLSPLDNHRINRALERLGFTVIGLEIDQFTRCGGGLHCLTMPLARMPG
jgi:N-dimethylarginine dimethylaminohydrolase